jgi:twinkle protein
MHTYTHGDASQIPMVPPPVHAITERIRGILPETFKKYQVVHDTSGSILFPYTDRRNKQLKAYKVRKAPFGPNPDKVMPWLGSYKSTALFGIGAVSSKALIICFGEFDALSAHQMTGYAAISPMNDDAAYNHILGNLDSLEGYSVIYVVPDNDKSGAETLDQVLNVLDLSVVKVVKLPLDVKDVNDMLMQGRGEEFKKVLWAGNPPNLKFIRSQATVTESTLKLMDNPSAFVGYSTGWEEYDDIAGGVRPGEIVTVGARTSMGKSTFSRAMAHRLQEHGVLFCGYEGRQDVDNILFASLEAQQPLLSMLRSGDAKQQAMAKHWVKQWGEASQISWVNTDMSDLKSFLRGLATHVKISGQKIVVLDHLHYLVNSMPGLQERQAIDTFMLRLHEAVVKLDVCAILVSHVSRNKDKAGKDRTDFNIGDYAGSSGIEKYSDVCVGLVGERYDPNVTITIEKNRLFGRRGEFNLAYQPWGDYL